MKGVMAMFSGMYKNFEYLWVSFFINQKIASKNEPDFPVSQYYFSDRQSPCAGL